MGLSSPEDAFGTRFEGPLSHFPKMILGALCSANQMRTLQCNQIHLYPETPILCTPLWAQQPVS